MLLDEAANHSELIDIQAAGDMKAALRGAESLNQEFICQSSITTVERSLPSQAPPEKYCKQTEIVFI